MIEEYFEQKKFLTSSKEIDLSMLPTNNYLIKNMSKINKLTVNFIIFEQLYFCSSE